MQPLPGGGEEGIGVGVGTGPGDATSQATASRSRGSRRPEKSTRTSSRRAGRASGGRSRSAGASARERRSSPRRGSPRRPDEPARGGRPRREPAERPRGGPGRQGAVGGDDELGVADGGGTRAGEAAEVERLDGADARLAADGGVEEGALQGQRGARGSESESNPGMRARTRPEESRAARKPPVCSSTRAERGVRERTRKEEAEGSPWVSQV